MSAGLGDRLWHLAEALHRLSGAAAKVAVVMLAHADRRGQAWPGNERIAAMTGQTVRSVRRALRELEAATLLAEIEARPGKRVRRTVCPLALSGEMGGSTPDTSVPPDSSVPPDTSVPPTHPTPDTSVRGGRTPVSGGEDVGVPRTQTRTQAENTLGEAPAEQESEPEPETEERNAVAKVVDQALVDLGSLAPAFRRSPIARRFATDGGTLEDFAALRAHAIASAGARPPIGLLWTWLSSAPTWRDVLLSIADAEKHAALRRKNSGTGEEIAAVTWQNGIPKLVAEEAER